MHLCNPKRGNGFNGSGMFWWGCQQGRKKNKKTFADKKKVFTFADPNGKAGRGTVPGCFLGGCPERAAEKNIKKKLAGNQKVVTFATRFCRKEEKKYKTGKLSQGCRKAPEVH